MLVDLKSELGWLPSARTECLRHWLDDQFHAENKLLESAF